MHRSLHYLVMKQQKSAPCYKTCYHLRSSIKYGNKNLEDCYGDTERYTFIVNFARLHLRGCHFDKKTTISLNEFSYTRSSLASCFDPTVANL